ncbi:MAG: hypothetical protein GY804_05525 [Alphaproteobacteria bacterium]|nr:hypothetical protein [Alphaproteobacteria bacterium]
MSEDKNKKGWSPKAKLALCIAGVVAVTCLVLEKDQKQGPAKDPKQSGQVTGAGEPAQMEVAMEQFDNGSYVEIPDPKTDTSIDIIYNDKGKATQLLATFVAKGVHGQNNANSSYSGGDEAKVTIGFGVEGEQAGRVSVDLGYSEVHYDLTPEEDAQFGNAAKVIVDKFNANQPFSQNVFDALVAKAAINFNMTRLEELSNELSERLKYRDGFVKECIEDSDGDVIFRIDDEGIQYVPDDRNTQVGGDFQSQLPNSAVPGNFLLKPVCSR